MEIYNISHAKTQLSSLIARVEQGEEIIIGRADKLVAKLVPYVPAEKPGFLGAARGRIAVPDAQDLIQLDQNEQDADMDLFSNAA